jgi:hypothetical protein
MKIFARLLYLSIFSVCVGADGAAAGECPKDPPVASQQSDFGLYWKRSGLFSSSKGWQRARSLQFLSEESPDVDFLYVQPASDHGGMISIKIKVLSSTADQTDRVRVHRTRTTYIGGLFSGYSDKDNPEWSNKNFSGQTYQRYHNGKNHDDELDGKFHSHYKYRKGEKNRRTNSGDRRKSFAFDGVTFKNKRSTPLVGEAGAVPPPHSTVSVRYAASELLYYKDSNHSMDCFEFNVEFENGDTTVQFNIVDLDSDSSRKFAPKLRVKWGN